MNIPLVPLFDFLIQTDPTLVELHQMAAWLGASVCAFFGILLLLMWVPGADKIGRAAKDRIQMGYGLLAIAAGFLILGIYLLAAFMVFSLFIIVVVVVRGLGIAFSKDE